MHRLTFALALALALPSLAPAQQPFAATGSTWTYTQGSCCWPDSNIAVITVPGDTLIEGRTYSKLEGTSGWFGCYSFAPFLRNSNDSMYYRIGGGSAEQLLFRWDAIPGATWSTPLVQQGFVDTLDWSVTDTGHVLIDGVQLRTLTVYQTSRQGTLFAAVGGVVTERLGPTCAPFTWVFAACDGETFLNTRCYTDPEISWINPQYPQCDLVSGIPEGNTPCVFSVYPSVVGRGDKVYVHMNTASLGPAVLLLRDATGRMLKNIPVKGNAMEISIEHGGMLWLTLESNGGLRATRQLLVR